MSECNWSKLNTTTSPHHEHTQRDTWVNPFFSNFFNHFYSWCDKFAIRLINESSYTCFCWFIQRRSLAQSQLCVCVCVRWVRGFFPACKLPIEMQLSKTNDVRALTRVCVCHQIFYTLFWFGLSIQTHGRLNLRFFRVSHFVTFHIKLECCRRFFRSRSFFALVWITIFSRYALFYHGFWWTVGMLASCAPFLQWTKWNWNKRKTNIYPVLIAHVKFVVCSYNDTLERTYDCMYVRASVLACVCKRLFVCK